MEYTCCFTVVSGHLFITELLYSIQSIWYIIFQVGNIFLEVIYVLYEEEPLIFPGALQFSALYYYEFVITSVFIIIIIFATQKKNQPGPETKSYYK